MVWMAGRACFDCSCLCVITRALCARRSPQLYTLAGLNEWRHGNPAIARNLFRLASGHRDDRRLPHLPALEAWLQLEQAHGTPEAVEAVTAMAAAAEAELKQWEGQRKRAVPKLAALEDQLPPEPSPFAPPVAPRESAQRGEGSESGARRQRNGDGNGKRDSSGKVGDARGDARRGAGGHARQQLGRRLEPLRSGDSVRTLQSWQVDADMQAALQLPLHEQAGTASSSSSDASR